MPWNGGARSALEGDDSGQRDRRGVVRRELVVARSYAAEVLQTAEGGLDAPALAVAGPVVADRPLAAALACPG